MAREQAAARKDSLTAVVADFATGTRASDIPPDVMELGKKSILDALAVGLSGSVAAGSVLIRRYVEGLGLPPGASTVFGTALRFPPRFAAFANGTAMHADDFDDTIQSIAGGPRSRQRGRMGLHPTAPVLAAVLAEAEAGGRSGLDVLVACHVGIEVGCKVFDATDAAEVDNGLHTTGTCALVGAAAALANLGRLSSGDTRRMLGIACDQTSGLVAQFGTMAKPWHAGRSSEGAILAKDLAAIGFTASETVLEAPGGYLKFEGGGFLEEPLRQLGSPWSFADRGIWLKPFPTGSLSHPAMTKTLELVRQHDIKPDQVAKVRLRTNKGIHDTLYHHRPKRRLEGKFSLEFCLATLIIERQLSVGHLTDEFVGRPDVQGLIERVDYSPYSEEEGRAGNYTLVTSFVEIDLKDGRTVGGRIDYGKGSKANPMSDEEVADKFRGCAAYARMPKATAEKVIALVRKLDRLENVRELASLLAVA